MKITSFPTIQDVPVGSESQFSPQGTAGFPTIPNSSPTGGSFQSQLKGDIYSSRGRFGNGTNYWDISATEMKTANFVTGVSGCRITYEGNVEFNDGNFRGDITGATGTFSGTVTVGSINIGGDDATSAHIDTDGNFWTGASIANKATAPARIANNGVAHFSSISLDTDVVLSGLQAGTQLAVQFLTAGSITSKAITLAVADGTGDSYIAAGKTDFTNADSGFILGIDDSDSNKAKFYIGNSTDYLNYDGTSLIVNSSKIVKLFTAGMQINSGEALYIYTDGKIYSTDAFNSYTGKFIGISTQAISKDATGLVQTFGTISGLSSLSAGTNYYLSNATHTIDQSQTTGAAYPDITQNSEVAYQSFTTGNGITELSSVLITGNGTAGNYTLTCRIRTGQGTGGSLLGTKVLLWNGSQDYTFHFDVPIVVTANTQYSITLETTAPAAYAKWKNASGTNPYAGGRADTGANDDYAFKTYYSTSRGALSSSSGYSPKKIGVATSSTEILLKDSDVLGSLVTARTDGGSYDVSTDTFIFGYMAAAGGAPTTTGYSGGTQVCYVAGNNGGSFSFAVPKGSFYQITAGGGATITAYQISLGN